MVQGQEGGLNALAAPRERVAAPELAGRHQRRGVKRVGRASVGIEADIDLNARVGLLTCQVLAFIQSEAKSRCMQ